MEALGYMLVYFMRGKLPGQGLKAKRDTKYLLVLEKKQATSASELCAGLPTEFVDYFTYVHELRDEGRPDYQRLRKMFTKLFRRQGFEYDNVFDWTIREFQRLGLDAEEPPTSNSVNGKRGVDTTKPWGVKSRLRPRRLVKGKDDTLYLGPHGEDPRHNNDAVT
ncbi:hypothetical protein LTR84_011457 [Exophiala bonariae]|uniref:Non-specific serine/threonine protein kinase n=1 Tax=Exophiala bonariae TaxID=1690606 RepID=A0AAV9MRM1_9EURO|nr:hypothetical protein LTR84_011457 [Exophiala bonariae]